MTEKFISGNGKHSSKQVYHSSRDCTYLRDTVRPVTDHEIEFHELELCGWCDDPADAANDGGQDWGYQQALRNASED